MNARFPLLFLCVALVFPALALALSGCGGGPAAIQAWTGPEKIEELKIKGALPDGAQSWIALDVPPRPADNDKLVARGKDLYAQACLACHGAEGKGDGPARAKHNLPTNPANLATPINSIKIRTTFDSPGGGGVPRDTDLFRTLTRGIPNTAMWSYRDLPAEDRWALVAYVQTLAKDYDLPSPPVVVPPAVPRDEGSLRIGAAAYQANCVTCHGRDGLGGSAAAVDPESGKPFPGSGFAREGGAKTLGGSADADLARTLLAGFHRKSIMRSFRPIFYDKKDMSPEERELADRKLWGTVYHVQELMRAQAKK